MTRIRSRCVAQLPAICLTLVLLPLGAAGQAGKSLADRIADLEAREAIRELIFAYGHALDHRDFVAFSELFAEQEGTWVGGFGTATGRSAIFGMMDEFIGHAEERVQPTSHHVFTNVSIEVDGDRAAATTRWIFVVPSQAGDPEWMFLGHYEDEFVREGGRWVFLRREAFTDIPVQ
ncbi:MAG TPA: nuclear transport factor 2 family protein [Gammaproteobacteria bacterium]